MRIQKTHDIEVLLKEVSKINPNLARKLSKAKPLTKYAVTYRYPDAERKPLTMAKAKTAIKVAEIVFELCIDEINKFKGTI